MAYPLCSTGIAPLLRYYGTVRPCPAHQYFRPRGSAACAFFPWHRRTGSQVPDQSPGWSHATSTPDTAWPVIRFPPCSSRRESAAPVLMPAVVLFLGLSSGLLALVSPTPT